MHQQQTDFENIVGKREIYCNAHFLLFPQCFLLNQIIVSPFVNIFDFISLFAAEFEEPKVSISGKGLKKLSTTTMQKFFVGCRRHQDKNVVLATSNLLVANAFNLTLYLICQF